MIAIRRLAVCGIYCWLTLNGSALSMAAENMSFRGTLIEQGPCIIKEEDKQLEIDFGDLQIDDVDGVNYQQNFFMMLRCEAPSGTHIGKMLMVRHLGAAASFDTAAVQSNITDFAIHTDYITNQGDGPFTLGKAFEVAVIDNSSSIAEYALIIRSTPIKRPGADVQPGEFSAISTLQLEYQ